MSLWLFTFNINKSSRAGRDGMRESERARDHKTLFAVVSILLYCLDVYGMFLSASLFSVVNRNEPRALYFTLIHECKIVHGIAMQNLFTRGRNEMKCVMQWSSVEERKRERDSENVVSKDVN
jgi:hypothetical protein